MNGRNQKLLLVVLAALALGNNLCAAASSSGLSSVVVTGSSAFASPSNSFFGWHNSTAAFMPSSSASSSYSSAAISLPINHVDQTKLRNLAEMQGYGYKTANLMIMRDDLVKKINEMLVTHPKFSSFVVHIPEFVGVPTTNVQSFLKENSINLEERWEELQEDLSLNLRAQALANKTLPEDFVAGAEKLANDIAALKPTNVALSKEVRKFLKEAKSKNWKLMFRSTGKEDNSEFSNAGGNESEANVEPTEEAFVKALLSVVASYLRPKSLQQRCEAGDKTIFDMPFIPLLVQRMIGEKDVIPTGCVVYTQEPEARLNGVSAMQCTFGHNAAVVDNKLSTDEYLVHNENVYATIKIKPARLVPALEGLVEQANPEALQKARALESVAAEAIGFVSQQIHEAYGMPMDLELAYEPDTKTIALVQARPIVYSKNEHVPSYLKDVSVLVPEKQLSGTTVITAGGFVRSIQNKDQVLTASHLDAALVAYNSGTIDKQKVNVVVVSDPKAGPYSHAAAIFRGAGIAVMHTPALAKLESWLGADDVALLVDVQRGLIVQAKEAELNEGFLNYPLPLQISAIDADEAFVIEPHEYFPEKNNAELVVLLAEGSRDQAQQALASIVQRINGALAEKQSLAACQNKQPACPEQRAAQRALEKLEALQQKVRAASSILNKHLSLPARDIRRLFPLRFLEALLIQASTPGIVDVDSFESIAKNFDEEMNFINNTVVPLISAGAVDQGLLYEDAMFALAFYGARVALTPELENQWTVFVDQIRQYASPEEKRLLFALKIDLDVLSMFDVWINRSFGLHAHTQPNQAIKELLSEYEYYKKDLHELKDKLVKLKCINLEDWGNPKQLKKVLARFEAEILSYFIQPDFVTSFNAIDKTSNPLMGMAIVKSLDTVVQYFDNAIKIIDGIEIKKGSSACYGSTEEKVMNFMLALEKYFWFQNSFFGDINSYVTLAVGRVFFNAEKSIKEHSQEGLESHLSFSKDFDVDVVVSGDFSEIKTLEDVFTSIHQLLNQGINRAFNLIEGDRMEKPAELEKVLNSWQEIFSEGDLVLLSAAKKEVIYELRVRLRWHSFTCKFVYDVEQKLTTIDFKISGSSDNQRWLWVDDYAATIPYFFDEEEKSCLLRSRFDSGSYYKFAKIPTKIAQKLAIHFAAMVEITFILSTEEFTTLDNFWLGSTHHRYSGFLCQVTRSAVERAAQKMWKEEKKINRLLLMSYDQKFDELSDEFYYDAVEMAVKGRLQTLDPGADKLLTKMMATERSLLTAQKILSTIRDVLKGLDVPENFVVIRAAKLVGDLARAGYGSELTIEIVQYLIETVTSNDSAKAFLGLIDTLSYIELVVVNDYLSKRQALIDILSDIKFAVASGYLFKEVAVIAQMCAVSSDYYVRSSAVILCENLVEKIDVMPEALKVKNTLIEAINAGLNNQELGNFEKQRLEALLERLKPSWCYIL